MGKPVFSDEGPFCTLECMTFEDYLAAKKIDEHQFKQWEPVRYTTWKTEFEQLHPESFTTQKKFLINEIRRKYPYGR